jgi:hypothetical protein
MKLVGISARAHPDGNRIDLCWENPDRPVSRVKVVRREAAYPRARRRLFGRVAMPCSLPAGPLAHGLKFYPSPLAAQAFADAGVLFLIKPWLPAEPARLVVSDKGRNTL